MGWGGCLFVTGGGEDIIIPLGYIIYGAISHELVYTCSHRINRNPIVVTAFRVKTTMTTTMTMTEVELS